jgi:hypothetical protein
MAGDYKTPIPPGKTQQVTPGSPGTDADLDAGGALSPDSDLDVGSEPTPHASAPQRHHEAWQPRVLKDAPFNSFESDARGADSRADSSTIRDPSYSPIRTAR